MGKSIHKSRSIKVSTIVPSPTAIQRDDISIESREMNPSVNTNYFSDLHRRYWKIDYIRTQSYDLLFSRLFAIFIWLYAILLESFAYSNLIQPSMKILNFLFGSSYSLKDISSILYASCAATYGISIEIYLIFPLKIINCILAINNCGINHRETITSLIYLGKVLALFLGTELSYQNFKRFTYQQSYELYYQKASRAMLRQSIYLIVTIIFLVAPGLRSISNAVQYKCSYLNNTNTDLSLSSCNIIDIERSVAEDEAICVNNYTTMICGMEQLRIIRDIALCNIAFYSMYNKSFLDITGKTTIIHKIILVLFFAICSSILVVNIDPLHFIQRKIYFNLIEIIFSAFLMILLIINLRKKSNDQRQFIMMQENPTIFG